MRTKFAMMLLMLAAMSTAAFATQGDQPGTQHSTYIGIRGGFAVHRIKMPAPTNITVDLLQNDAGERFLVVTNETTGDIESFSVPEPRTRGRGGDEVTIQETTTEPIIVRADGTGAWSVFVDGVFVGVLTIDQNGIKFTPVPNVVK